MDKTDIYATLNDAYFSSDPDENAILASLPLLLKSASVVVDVGASLGQYTKAMAHAFSGGEIWAIEADPIRVEELRRNCARWSAETKNTIVVKHLALADRSGDVPYFVTNSDVSGGLTKHETPRAVDWEEITIPSASLDDLFPIRPPDLVKIDVEGAELTVLEGATRILAAPSTTFLIEIHDWPEAGDTPERVRKLMHDAGYLALSFYGQPLFTKSRRLWIYIHVARLLDGRRLLRRVRRMARSLPGASSPDR
jgi:FkbM family methyltransferase